MVARSMTRPTRALPDRVPSPGSITPDTASPSSRAQETITTSSPVGPDVPSLLRAADMGSASPLPADRQPDTQRQRIGFEQQRR